MTPETPREPAYGVGREHDSRVDYVAVQRAAIEQLVAGVRPTVANLRQKLGTGSATTLHQLLGQFWAELGKDLEGETAVAMRLPAHVARAAESLWFAALEEAEKRVAVSKEKREEGVLDREQRQQLREHAVSLREQELESRLLQRDQLIAQLQAHIKTQLTLAERDRQTIESLRRRNESQRKMQAAVDQLLAEIAPIRQTTNVLKGTKRVRKRSQEGGAVLRNRTRTVRSRSAARKRRVGRRR